MLLIWLILHLFPRPANGAAISGDTVLVSPPRLTLTADSLTDEMFPADDDDFWAGVDSLVALIRADSLGLDPADNDSLSGGEYDFGTPLFPGLESLSGGYVIDLYVGSEIEGMAESFGSETLSPTGSGVDDQLEGLRYTDDDTDLLAVMNLRGRGGAYSDFETWWDLEGKAGDARKSVTFEGTATGRFDGGKRLSCRDLFLWDNETDSYQNTQNIVQLDWADRLGGDWRYGIRGAYEISRTADESDRDTEIPDGASDSVTVLSTGFLDYHKVGLRFRLGGNRMSSASYVLELKRKWVAENGNGSYEAMVFEAGREWFKEDGLLSLDFSGQRRYYLERSSAFRSFWELDGQAAWRGLGAGGHWEFDLQLLGTLYDDWQFEESTELLTIEDDRLLVEAGTFYRHGSGGPWGLLLDMGVGLGGDLVRSRAGELDSEMIKLATEWALRPLREQRAAWFDISCEAGYRNYRADADENKLIIEGYNLSISQSDYRFLRLSLLAGGDLGKRLEWNSYCSLDEEWHETDADNGRFISFSLALKYRFSLTGSAADVD
jgi:hypothetical protein